MPKQRRMSNAEMDALVNVPAHLQHLANVGTHLQHGVSVKLDEGELWTLLDFLHHNHKGQHAEMKAIGKRLEERLHHALVVLRHNHPYPVDQIKGLD